MIQQEYSDILCKRIQISLKLHRGTSGKIISPSQDKVFKFEYKICENSLAYIAWTTNSNLSSNVGSQLSYRGWFCCYKPDYNYSQRQKSEGEKSGLLWDHRICSLCDMNFPENIYNSQIFSRACHADVYEMASASW